MRVGPVSGDLVVQLVLGVAVAGAAIWAIRRATGAAGDALATAADTAGQALQAINPANPDNVIYTGVNTATGGTPDQPLGGRIFDFFNPDALAGVVGPVPAPAPSSPAWSTAGGRWNNPSAYTAPGTTGSGGAAFGIYPRP